MPYVSPEAIQRAKAMDLKTYLETFEPGEMVRISGEVYCTKEHDSLKISNGKWYWYSRQIGGKSALDYLIKVRGMRFVEAVELLSGERAMSAAPPRIDPPKKEKIFRPPERNGSAEAVIRYLTERGIDPAVTGFCIANGTIYESAKYHNAVFVGRDAAGTARYASLRGTCGKPFKGEAPGSDKRFGFLLPGTDAGTVHIFEAAIDALSYATLRKLVGRNWQAEALLSLGGVSAPPKNAQAHVPAALAQYLADHPDTATIVLHLDNDEVGRGAAKSIATLLRDRYTVLDRPAPQELQGKLVKDVNDYLLARRQQARRRSTERIAL